jgi:hypothetical protein
MHRLWYSSTERLRDRWLVFARHIIVVHDLWGMRDFAQTLSNERTSGNGALALWFSFQCFRRTAPQIYSLFFLPDARTQWGAQENRWVDCGLGIAELAAHVRRHKASPNDGPAQRFGDSGTGGEPPSVS